MYKYIVLQICCCDCRQFFNIYHCNDFYDFIINLDNYIDFSYLIYNIEDLSLVCSLDGEDL